MNSGKTPRLDRRTALKWMLAATAAARLPGSAFAQERRPDPAPVPGGPPESPPNGYGRDPDLLRDYEPGDLWPPSFTEAQGAAAAALCALIIPADEHSPSAADLGVHAFIDEWISAPYAEQRADRPVVLEGLDWLDAEAGRRFSKTFAALDISRQSAIADDICDPAAAAPGLKKAADFFARFRALTAGGFYTTPQGMADIGYVGNRAALTFEGPPREVLERVGLA